MALNDVSNPLNSSDNSEDGSDDAEEESIGKKTRVKASAVHDEFSRMDVVSKRKRKKGGEPSSVLGSKCNHCSSHYVGKNPTTLLHHLKASHVEIFKQVQQKDEEGRAAQKAKASEGESKSSSGRKTASSALFPPSPLDKFFNRSSKTVPPMPVAKQKDIDRRMAYWVGSSTLPLNFVEEGSFHTFIQGYDIQVCLAARITW